MQLLRLGKLGSFDFNSRFYADDDLIVGAADPFQLFRIIFEVIRGGGLNNPDVAFMLDQCHNVEKKIPGQIRSVLNVQEMTARALLVDRGGARAPRRSRATCSPRTPCSWTRSTPTCARARRVARVARPARRPDGRVRGIRLPGEDRGRPRRRRAGRLGRVAPMSRSVLRSRRARAGLSRARSRTAPGSSGRTAAGSPAATSTCPRPTGSPARSRRAARRSSRSTTGSRPFRRSGMPPVGAPRRRHYPAASDDILAAWSWAVDNAGRLRIDPERLAIGGASAGAQPRRRCDAAADRATGAAAARPRACSPIRRCSRCSRRRMPRCAPRSTRNPRPTASARRRCAACTRTTSAVRSTTRRSPPIPGHARPRRPRRASRRR